MLTDEDTTALKTTEEILNALEAIRGKTGVLETEMSSVVNLYIHVSKWRGMPTSFYEETSLPVVNAGEPAQPNVVDQLSALALPFIQEQIADARARRERTAAADAKKASKPKSKKAK